LNLVHCESTFYLYVSYSFFVIVPPPPPPPPRRRRRRRLKYLDRLLTSCQESSCLEGLDLLVDLCSAAGQRIIILIGGRAMDFVFQFTLSFSSSLCHFLFLSFLRCLSV
jgi:hypothetical protein